MENTGKALVELMRKKLPRGSSLAKVLMDTFSMSKESVYRRLRGEVPFTFDEAVAISRKLGISLDKLVGAYYDHQLLFDLNFYHISGAAEAYAGLLDHYLTLFGRMADDPEAEFYLATNTLPFFLYSGYETLVKFRIGCWWSQRENILPVNGLLDIRIPQDVIEKHRQARLCMRHMPRTWVIWDSELFRPIVSEIRYFAQLGMLSAQEVAALKAELMMILDEIEQLAVQGQFSADCSLNFYVSNIHFDSNYAYLHSRELKACLFRVYSLNFMDSQHSQLCELQRNWLLSLKRHSTLISQCGEIQRKKFLQDQRARVNTL